MLFAAVVLAGGCSLTGEADIETTAAAVTIEGVVDDAEAELSDTGGYADLERCPMDPGGILLTRAVDGLTENEDVARGQANELVPVVNEIEAAIPVLVACDRFDDFSGVGLVVAQAPADFDRYLRIFNQGSDGEPDLSVERFGSSEHRGGTLHRVCVEDQDAQTEDEDISYCEVNWLDQNLLVTVYVSGPTSLGIDLDVLEAGLVSILDDVMVNLGGTEA